MDAALSAWLAVASAFRLPVVYIGADRADGIAVEIRALHYLPADAIVGTAECLVLRGIGA